ncbi:MAG: hypothetical protein GKR89_21995 [Candidatus Latescibacteria bacterium]|nr:hypothetical protein [Candidatus Latescibacterota bacterium]
MLLTFLLQACGGGENPVAEQPAETAPLEAEETAGIQFIGDPFLTGEFYAAQHGRELSYAKNVWDMQVWDGKIYLGHGNSNNTGPATGVAPMSVVYYDPQGGVFETEFTTNECQIDRYRVIDGHLYIPGHDPRAVSFDLGNFYRLDAAGWVKVRTIPFGAHTYDIFGFDDALFVAEGTANGDGATVSRSLDGGMTWDSFQLVEDFTTQAYELFTLNNNLYVSTFGGSVHRYSKFGFFTPVNARFIPDAEFAVNARMIRTVLFDETLLYIGADRQGAHQWTPIRAYRAPSVNQIQELAIPAADLPYDILVRHGRTFLLTNRRVSSGYRLVIYESADLESWGVIAEYDIPSFARSFEYHDGCFYVGLGTDQQALNPASGSIYRIVF